MKNDTNEKVVILIKKQFLCHIPLNKFNFRFDALNNNSTLQLQILQNTVLSEQVLQYPVNLIYQQKFLKAIINNLETNQSEIEEAFYDEFGKLISFTPEERNQRFNTSYKHYWIEESKKSIILKEDACLISEGTTGLHTWEAGLALSEWIILNQDQFRNKVTLELGSGVGLTGLVLSLHCQPKTFYFSDCHHSVLKKLCDNIEINITGNSSGTGLLLDNSLLKTSVSDSSAVQVLDLPWENATKHYCKQLGHIDNVIAADVVFDEDIFQPLIGAIHAIFTYCEAKQFILCCKQRNEKTLVNFLHLLENKFSVKELERPQQQCFIWDSDGIRIFSVTASTVKLNKTSFEG